VTGYNGEGWTQITMRHGDPGVSRGGNCGSDTRHNFKRYSGRRKSLSLPAASAEHERVAAL
jgi:hypothetical protein